METKETLAPCPFCGETERLYLQENDRPYLEGFHVECSNCAAFGPHEEDRAQAIANWNRRPTSTLGQIVAGPDRSVIPLRVYDDLAAARERRELANLPSVSTTTEDAGLSMDFDMGGPPPKGKQ